MSAKQRGNALPCVMILIVLMGVLSITGMRSALLESRITDAQRRQELAFQQAESVLSYARSELVQQHLDVAMADPTGAVSYSVPDSLVSSGYAAEDATTAVSPGLTLRTLSRSGSLVSGEPTAANLTSVWVELNVTTYNGDGSPAVSLQELVLRAAGGGI